MQTVGAEFQESGHAAGKFLDLPVHDHNTLSPCGDVTSDRTDHGLDPHRR
jgi:hypothetical protein